MAEDRSVSDLGFGPPSLLSNLLPGERKEGHMDENQPPLLHASRITWNCPSFNLIGSFAELYTPSKTALPLRTHSHLYGERNLQRRWLLKSHPEAFMGNEVLSEMLTEDLARFPSSDEPTVEKPLLALGEMADRSTPSKPVPTQLLAMATGASGELLRLTHVDDSQWIWDEDRESVLHLSVIDSLDNFEEATWASDGLPISQIKFVASTTSTSDPVQWLLIQKQTSTSILQPEYNKNPLTREQKVQPASQQSLSRINPNLLVTLGHQETGGSAHVDVTVSQPEGGRPPQLCVMDECGYWTLWNILGKTGFGKSSIRLSLCKCGHTMDGRLQEIPRIPVHGSESHGLFFIGNGRLDDPSSNDPNSKLHPRQPSRYLLAWNSKHIDILDLETDISLPNSDVITSMSNNDRILDVQPSPVSQNHIFVITTKSLMWVDVFHPSASSTTRHHPAARLVCPHLFADSDSIKLSLSRASDDDMSAAMVVVYSTKRPHATVFWFRFTAQHFPEWHRQRILLPRHGNPQSGVQMLTFQPVRLANSPEARGLGVKLRRGGGQFFQGMVLSDDLALSYCMALVTRNPSLTPSLPTTRLGWTQPDQHKKWRKKRQRILRRMGDYFVIPDAMAEVDEQLLGRPPRPDNKSDPTLQVFSAGRKARASSPATLDFGRLRGAMIGSIIGTTNRGELVIPIALIDAIESLVQHGQFTDILPLRTWLDVAEGMSINTITHAPETSEKSSREALDTLFGTADGQTIFPQLNPNMPPDPIVSLRETKEQFADMWLQPLRDRMPEQYIASRERWISELATSVTLETFGVTIQESPLFKSPVPASAQLSQSIPSSAPFLPAFQIPSSQPYGSSIPSSSQTQASTPNASEAFERLRLLAPGLQPGTIGAGKPAQVLSLWPAERGVSTDDYISSVAIATERKFDPAKQRLQKIEAKRRAMADKYGLQSTTRRGLDSQVELPLHPRSQPQQDLAGIPMRPARPAVAGIRTSQQVPSSSQSQGLLTMSQPIPGAFGERKKSKKIKKKSGFR